RASGPGGQNVNKVSSAVRLRFDLESAALPSGVRARLQRLVGNQITTEGELLIEAQGERSQARNRQEALDQLVELLRQAAKKPKKRLKTRPSKAARQRRLEAKQHHSQKKKQRRYRPRDEY
ncbi:MAG: aminoacyl-tRNA hydrolase, partial [Anaerolineales bacterium]|nr:aminoacyl-tRNA hydrolase [Anaerolineales bacterium]